MRGGMKLWELKVYKIAREISRDTWDVYKEFDWHTKKVIGDQWLRSTDSISANIAEGFGRFHYLDKNKFNYNARGSLFESLDWVDKLGERDLLKQKLRESLTEKLKDCLKKLNGYIKTTKNQKCKEQEETEK